MFFVRVQSGGRGVCKLVYFVQVVKRYLDYANLQLSLPCWRSPLHATSRSILILQLTWRDTRNRSSSLRGLEREISTLTACLNTVLIDTLSSSMGLDAWT